MVKRQLVFLGVIETGVVFPPKRWAFCFQRVLPAVVLCLLRRKIHRAILVFKQRLIVPLWNPKRGCLFGHCSIKNAQLNRTLVIHFVGAYHRCELGISSRMAFCFAICLQLMRLFSAAINGCGSCAAAFFIARFVQLIFLIRQYVLYRKGNNHAVPKSEQLLAR